MTNVSGSASESYIFDSVGNRTSSSRSASYTYQANNRLTSTATGAYTYNANGTMASKFENGKGLWRYNWDHENRLYEASTRKQRIRYRYDALGRRISRYIAGGKENTKFTYDGNDVVLDDNSGVITKYQNGLGIDNKLKMVTNGVSKYFLQDHLGSTTALTNSSGSIVESASYDSFGNATGNLSTRYGYTGREFDADLGLQYSRARWYDAKVGRFISEDPIGFAGGDVNLYGYVGNNSSNLVDPSGLDGCRKMPNGNCVAEQQTPTGDGEPIRKRPRMFGDPPPTTPSPTPSATPYSTPTPPSTSNGGTECECTDSPYQNSFPGTFQIGLGGNGTLGPFPVTGGVGLAVDTSGNVGFYYEGGTGAGLGAEANGGVQLAVTNASNINDLSGIFVNPGGGLGAGVAGSGNLMFGTSPSGPIVGGGVILGGGGGGGVSVTVTNTGIIPLFNIPKLLGGKNCAR